MPWRVLTRGGAASRVVRCTHTLRTVRVGPAHVRGPMMGGPLPATPETYLALRASRQDLRALPVSSFETLITDTGRSGLAGVIAHIISDVLDHSVADAGTARQHRLVAALLCTSVNSRKLPLRPDVIARLTAELLSCITSSGDPPVDGIPLQVTAHVLRVLLQHGNASQRIIQALIDRLVRDTAFPFVDEGLVIIEYVLRHGEDAHIALPLLASMINIDGGNLGEQAIVQARADGAAWEEWARSSTLRDRHTVALRISLWALCCRAWLRLNRTRRFQSTFAELFRELKEADARVHMPDSPSSALLYNLLQVHLVNLAASGSPNSVRAAVAALYEAPRKYEMVVSPAVVARVCQAALALGLHRDAVNALRSVLRPDPTLISAVGFPAIVAIMESAAHDNDAGTVRRIVHSVEWNSVPQPLRAQFLAATARAQLTQDAATLYHEWSDTRGIMTDEERRALNRPWMHDTQPAVRIKAARLSGEPVTTTPRCVVSLARLFHRSAAHRGLARVVRDDYLRALYAIPLRTHEQLTALAQVCFIVGDTAGARHAMGEIIHRRDAVDIKDMAVLVGGMMGDSPDLALHTFFYLLRGDKAAGAEPLVPTASLYAVLIAKAIHVRRIDIARALYSDLVRRGLAPSFAREAPHLEVSLSQRSIPELVAAVSGMLREGWRPASAHLSWVVRCVLRGLRPIDALEGAKVRKSQLSHIAAAVRLFVRGAAAGSADLPSARLIFMRLAKCNEAHAITLADRVVAALRSTRELARRAELDRMLNVASPPAADIPPALVDDIVDTYAALGDKVGASEAAALKDSAAGASRTKAWWNAGHL